MVKTTLQFNSLSALAAFIEGEGLTNYEINHNQLTVSCELENETIQQAHVKYGAYEPHDRVSLKT
jgi:hypothetical protein